jgi:hypothetical protein
MRCEDIKIARISIPTLLAVLEKYSGCPPGSTGSLKKQRGRRREIMAG